MSTTQVALPLLWHNSLPFTMSCWAVPFVALRAEPKAKRGNLMVAPFTPRRDCFVAGALAKGESVSPEATLRRPSATSQ
ncbi:MAG: hypothetical protein WBC55_00665 [Dehalococcoidia bacterium]